MRFRILDKDKNEISTWTTTGVVEPGAGYYGVVTVINSDAQKYIQYWDVEDTLYLTDPINRDLITGPEYSATSYKSGIVSQRLGVQIQSPALKYGLKK